MVITLIEAKINSASPYAPYERHIHELWRVREVIVSHDLPAPMKLIATTTTKQMVIQAEFTFVFLSQKSIKTAAALSSAGRTIVKLYQ